MNPRIRVLQLEDNPNDAKLVQHELTKGGLSLEIRVVDDEASYRRELIDFQPECVLSDYSTPRFHAPEALAVLKELGISVPFILVTGSRTDEEAAQVLKAGASDYVLKSHLARLPAAITNALDREEAHRTKLQAEEALRHKQIMLARTEGIAQIGSWVWEIATDTVTWSDELFRIFQRDPREGAPSFAEHPAFFHPDDMARLQQAVEAVVALGTPYQLELRAMRKDGETRVCVARGLAEMAPGGQVVRLFGSLQDITERKQAEDALRESEDQFKYVFEAANVGKSITMPSGEVRPNRAFCQMLGYTPEELKGKSWQELTPPDEVEEIERILEPLKKGEKDAARFNKRYICKGGSLVWADVSTAMRRNSDGTLRYFITTIVDISERKQLEQAVEKARADFLFAVSHELKTPLQVMGTTQEMIESLPEERQLAQFRQYGGIWRRNLMRLRSIIENLVDSQRPAGMGFKLEKQPTNLMDLTREVVRELEPVASAHSVKLHLQGESLPPLSLDRNAVWRLLENLLTNAIKFSHLEGQVEIRLRAEGGMICLEVCDFGMGVDPQIKSFLFQPFYRSPEAVKAGVQGTGLGLYVSKMIAEAHGGTIQLESELGKGTTVTVQLPTQAVGS